MPYWFGFVLAVFAAFGLYFLFTLLLGVFFGDNTYTPLIFGDGLSKEDLMIAVQSAKRSIEASSNLCGIPTVLFSENPSFEIAELLRENAIPFAILS